MREKRCARTSHLITRQELRNEIYSYIYFVTLFGERKMMMNFYIGTGYRRSYLTLLKLICQQQTAILFTFFARVFVRRLVQQLIHVLHEKTLNWTIIFSIIYFILIYFSK